MEEGYNVTSVWSFIVEDDDGNVVCISFIGYTRACCGTQHEKEKSYGTFMKDMIQHHFDKESDQVKWYLDSMKATSIVADVENIDGCNCHYGYHNFVIFVSAEQRYLDIPAFSNKMGYYSSFIWLIRELVTKFHLTSKYVI